MANRLVALAAVLTTALLVVTLSSLSDTKLASSTSDTLYVKDQLGHVVGYLHPSAHRTPPPPPPPPPSAPLTDKDRLRQQARWKVIMKRQVLIQHEMAELSHIVGRLEAAPTRRIRHIRTVHYHHVYHKSLQNHVRMGPSSVYASSTTYSRPAYSPPAYSPPAYAPAAVNPRTTIALYSGPEATPVAGLRRSLHAITGVAHVISFYHFTPAGLHQAAAQAHTIVVPSLDLAMLSVGPRTRRVLLSLIRTHGIHLVLMGSTSAVTLINDQFSQHLRYTTTPCGPHRTAAVPPPPLGSGGVGVATSSVTSGRLLSSCGHTGLALQFAEGHGVVTYLALNANGGVPSAWMSQLHQAVGM